MKKHGKLLTDVFEIDIIELPKANKDIENGRFNSFGNLEKWVEFFIDPFGKEISEMKEMSDELLFNADAKDVAPLSEIAFTE